MWSTFIDWLENLVRERGLIPILGAIGVLFATLTGVGLFSDHGALWTVSLGILIFILLVLNTAQYVDRRRLYQTRSDSAVALDRYAEELLSRQTADSFDIVCWDERQWVKPHGHTIIERYLTIRVRDAPLDFFWHRAYVSRNDDDYSYHRKVVVDLRFYDMTTGESVSIPKTIDWDGHSLRLFAHFLDAQPAGSVFMVKLRFDWPEYSRDLIDNGIAVPVEWKLRRKTERLVLEITLDKRVAVNKAVATRPYAGTPVPTHRINTNKDALVELEITGEQLLVNQTIGFLLQLVT